jgi:valyl-tRNA synthetase
MAKKGEKISKSKNNSENSPGQLIEKYSADAIRYWAAGAKLGTDTMYSEEEMLLSNRFLTKLWNAGKFTLMHLHDYNGEKPEKILPIDRWIIERQREIETRAAQYMDKYEMGIARGEIDEFFWKDYCDNYLEIVKERVYKPEIHGELERRSGQYALYTAFMGILRMYAIYTPHITEEIYQDFFRGIEGKLSLHQHQWIREDKIDSFILEFGERIKDILKEVRKYKSDRNLSLKEPLNKIDICIPGYMLCSIEQTKKDLIACTGAQEIIINSGDEFRFGIENQ